MGIPPNSTYFFNKLNLSTGECLSSAQYLREPIIALFHTLCHREYVWKFYLSTVGPIRFDFNIFFLLRKYDVQVIQLFHKSFISVRPPFLFELIFFHMDERNFPA